MRLPDFDPDYLILALIGFAVMVWISGWQQSENELFLASAKEVVIFVIGVVAGYLTKQLKKE
jgi:uncharacterized membrane protein YeaQ/YmgE (transglycosylase-associated protein family)